MDSFLISSTTRLAIIRNLFALALAMLMMHATPCAAMEDMLGKDISGLTIGMSVPEVDKVLSNLQDVISSQAKTRKPKPGIDKPSLQKKYLRFSDDRFLFIGFSTLHGEDRVSQVRLVYQGRSYSKDLADKLLSGYGNPDFHNKQGDLEIFAWGGAEVLDGAVTPGLSVGATLLIEHLKGTHVNISLTQAQH